MILYSLYLIFSGKIKKNFDNNKNFQNGLYIKILDKIFLNFEILLIEKLSG